MALKCGGSSECKRHALPSEDPVTRIHWYAIAALVSLGLFGGYWLFDGAGDRSATAKKGTSQAKVTSIFKGSKYTATVVNGGIGLRSDGAPVFSGIIKGLQKVNRPDGRLTDALLKLADKESSTNVKILDYDLEKDEFLVDGEVEVVSDQTLFWHPGSVIENATSTRLPVNLNPRFSNDHLEELPFGRRVQVTLNGARLIR